MDEPTVEPVRDKKGLRRFITFPWTVYKNDPYWVPPLISTHKDLFNPDRNPFYRHARVELFLARRDRMVVGRIASIVNDNHNSFHKDRVGFFGFFESLQDFGTAGGLLSAARDWLRAQGMDTMRGPMNFSTNEECGLLIDGFDSSPVFMMPYNPKYYVDFMDRFGLKKGRDLLAYFLTQENVPPDELQATLEKIKRRAGIRIRRLNMGDFEEEIRRVKEVYNSAWSRNWGFVPMTDEEIAHMARQLKKIIDPDLVLFAEIDGRPIGFSLALPDLNQALKRINGRLFPLGLFKLLWYSKKIDGVRVLTMGVIPEYQNKGIAAMFGVESFKVGVPKGYVWGEMSWVLEDNTLMRRALERMGAKIYKKYRIYEMAV
ncbi:MAG: GNAT family N-acetyltransferase [bacterium]